MGKMWMTQSIFDPLEMSETVAPRNPRDHSILEAIWQGMLESRFVNSTPLSLLPTYLEYHFKGGSKNTTPLGCLFIDKIPDVRTHPPLLYSFPPLPTKPAKPEAKKTTSPPEDNNSATPTSQPAPKSPKIKTSHL